MEITQILDKVYVLNPGYVMRNDITRAVLATRDNSSYHSLDVNDVSTILHPAFAVLLSFFDGSRTLKDTLNEVSSYFNISFEGALKTVSKLIDNKSGVAVEYDGHFFYLPQNVLVEKKAERTECYSPGDFKIKTEVDLEHERLNKPIYASFLVSNRCVTDCIYCYADKRRIYDCTIPFQSILELIEEAKSIGIISFDIQGGELFLYKDWDKLLTALYGAGYSVYISTKYPLSAWEIERLKATGTKEIQISLDSIYGNDLMTNLKVGPGYRDRILKSIDLLDKAGIRIKIKGVITGPIFNLNKIEDYINYFDKYANVEVVELTAPSHSLYKTAAEFSYYRLSEEQLSALSELAEREKGRHHFELRTDIPSREEGLSDEEKKKSFYARSSCSGNMSSFMILPDGNVTYCEETYFNPNLMLGNILNSSIMDVWNSERARNLFYLPKSIFPKESPCATCREFEDCRYSKGICWVDVMAAYGEDKWLYPTPDCPYAPVPLNDIKVW